MIKIAHIITGLHTGGAEKMLTKLLANIDKERFSGRVYCLVPPKLGAAPIQALGVPLETLGMQRDRPNPFALLRLGKLLRENPPDLVQTWMYHADLIGGFAAKLSNLRAPVVWNIRHSTFEAGSTRKRTMYVAKVCATVSHWLPDTIVCCSQASERIHSDLGYDAEKIRVIPNGFDLSQFRPDPVARKEVRAELGIPENATVIGRFGRFDPQKDYETFIKAAARLRQSRPDARFVLCGFDIDANNAAVGSWLDAAGIRDACHLLGYRHDAARVINALDLATSSSAYGEAFPNVLGEAMACEVPCVTTDVGDSAFIVGDTGTIVQPRDPNALADAWDAMLAKGPDHLHELGRLARQRVEQKFSIREVVRAYENTYEAVVAKHSGTSGRHIGTVAARKTA